MECFMGIVMPFAGTYAPYGWHLCDGAILSVAANSALFSLLGNAYGGDGISTFALPDLRGRAAVGSDYENKIGTDGGTENVTLTSSQMPVHSHNLEANINGNTPGTSIPSTNSGFGIAKIGMSATNMYNTFTNNYNDLVSLKPGTLSPTGSGAAHSNMQPYQVLNYIICMNGYYPMRP